MFRSSGYETPESFMKKLIHSHSQAKIPFLMWQNWTIGDVGLVSPEKKIYTPGTIRLLEWKGGFYDMEKLKAENHTEHPYESHF